MHYVRKSLCFLSELDLFVIRQQIRAIRKESLDIAEV